MRLSHSLSVPASESVWQPKSCLLQDSMEPQTQQVGAIQPLAVYSHMNEFKQEDLKPTHGILKKKWLAFGVTVIGRSVARC